MSIRQAIQFVPGKPQNLLPWRLPAAGRSGTHFFIFALLSSSISAATISHLTTRFATGACGWLTRRTAVRRVLRACTRGASMAIHATGLRQHVLLALPPAEAESARKPQPADWLRPPHFFVS